MNIISIYLTFDTYRNNIYIIYIYIYIQINDLLNIDYTENINNTSTSTKGNITIF